jgi:hypothetical protein
MAVNRALLDARTYRLGCGAALIAGPALFFVDNLFHPEELTRGNEAEQLAVIAADPAAERALHEIQQSPCHDPPARRSMGSAQPRDGGSEAEHVAGVM